MFSYGYRQAVVDGWLIDHLPPRRITTALAQTGIVFEAGEEVHQDQARANYPDIHCKIVAGMKIRTPDGITRATHLPQASVLDILAQLYRVGSQKPFRVWQGTVSGQEVFTLALRKPSWIRSLPVIGEMGNLLERPTID